MTTVTVHGCFGDWLEILHQAQVQKQAVTMADDPLTLSLGFTVEGETHRVRLNTVRDPGHWWRDQDQRERMFDAFPGDMRERLRTIESRQALYQGGV